MEPLLTAPLWLRSERSIKRNCHFVWRGQINRIRAHTIRKTSPRSSLAFKLLVERSTLYLHPLLKITDRAGLRDFDVGMPDKRRVTYCSPQQER